MEGGGARAPLWAGGRNAWSPDGVFLPPSRIRVGKAPVPRGRLVDDVRLRFSHIFLRYETAFLEANCS